MRIPCPYCGPRDVSEFSYRGDATPARPEGEAATAEAFHTYIYVRENPAGPIREHWYHASGCRSWVTVTRDTRTHEVSCAVLAKTEAG